MFTFLPVKFLILFSKTSVLTSGRHWASSNLFLRNILWLLISISFMQGNITMLFFKNVIFFPSGNSFLTSCEIVIPRSLDKTEPPWIAAMSFNILRLLSSDEFKQTGYTFILPIWLFFIMVVFTSLDIPKQKII